MSGPGMYRSWAVPERMSRGKMEDWGWESVVVISVARRRKRAVCLRAGRGVFGRVVDMKLWSQVGVGWRWRAFRWAVISAAMFAIMCVV